MRKLINLPQSLTACGLWNLNGLQIRNDGGDVIALELEFRHIRMAGDEAFPQGFLQGLDRVPLCQRAKQGGLRMAALVGASRGMATRAFLGEKNLSTLEGGGVLGSRRRNGESHGK